MAKCTNGQVKGELSPKISVANMIELLLKSFLVYHSPMFEAWKVPKRPVEVSRDAALGGVPDCRRHAGK